MDKGATRRLNLGIFAHVDAGKTTTTEHILYESGRIRALGSVDEGTAQTDSLEVERQRGISVRSAIVSLEWRGTQINLVDTPGHVDFLSEVERSMRVMDCAVLILSAAEGVQAQSETVWNALRRLKIPTLLFVNKMDRIGADPARVLEQVRAYLSDGVIPVQRPLGAGLDYSGAADLWADAPGSPERTALLESLAERDEDMLARYLAGETDSAAGWKAFLARETAACRMFPLLYGAAAKAIGIGPLLDAVIDYLPPTEGDPEAPLSGIVFGVQQDPGLGKAALVRLYRGRLRNRDAVPGPAGETGGKVTQIRRLEGGRAQAVPELAAGDIAAVYGLADARVGDVLGSPDAVPPEAKLAVPLLTVRVFWEGAPDHEAMAAFRELADEDPLLDAQWLPEDRELHIKVMGKIQLEILASVVRERFGLAVTFGPPSVIYKETPARAGEGFIAYTMPKPCWAILRFAIEPLPRGSGLIYESIVRSSDLLPQYQNETARRVPEALSQGLFGWEVTDLRVTLVEGQHHVWHTHPLDFAVATPMGLMDGLARTGTKLLEPMLRVRIAVPEENAGRVMNDLVQMRGSFEPPLLREGRIWIEGRVPLATSLDYPASLGSFTKGRGTFSSVFDGYEECPPDVKAERTRRGVNPLDQARYILSVRKALQG
ncbi:TetM/TetW/TetO/TetS family tetracycline resistance ribosomal protection protein [Paenibacillus spiritus]|uniref:TetM/TetW/TetO/TetS family tetracycline resistance ribosomal protection protein n=1 Tax=Paenibacillus spiritus TaxID=2496557 RepID=A0A5J5G9W1_9BACL|nr:TetM/TetW/TetO/TetS family tetracycline resistance ribosomal protection protein [Paenibacillus spiritus]KAA9004885.1 TetM/TetW/TetO/TetS family tetracycline resistance ribosomal protection protein [Paenibacillus spiritus]